jgi:magnesium transporter
MSNDPNTILVQSIKRLLRRRALPHLRNIVAKTHAADLSIVFHSLSVGDQCQLFDMIADVEKKGVLFSELDKDTLIDLLDELSIEKIVPVLEEMPADDAAGIIDSLPDERADLILQQMKREESDEVEDLLRFEDDTAGRVMTTDYIALNQDLTAGEAITAIQSEYSDVEMPFYLYLVDEYDKLVGVSSLRQLVLVPPTRELRHHDPGRLFGLHRHGSGGGGQDRGALRHSGGAGGGRAPLPGGDRHGGRRHRHLPARGHRRYPQDGRCGRRVRGDQVGP